MIKDNLIKELESSYGFFKNTIECLSEEDSGFAPKEGMFTVSQQVAHAAQTISWFIDGAFVSNGFDMNFEKLENETKNTKSLDEAKKIYEKAMNEAKAVLEKSDDEELNTPLPEGPIMGGIPKHAVIGALSDHTAHHRGALAVYARLLGKEPKMPYG